MEWFGVAAVLKWDCVSDTEGRHLHCGIKSKPVSPPLLSLGLVVGLGLGFRLGSGLELGLGLGFVNTGSGTWNPEIKSERGG